jgi:hypothetical protein
MNLLKAAFNVYGLLSLYLRLIVPTYLSSGMPYKYLEEVAINIFLMLSST